MTSDGERRRRTHGKARKRFGDRRLYGTKDEELLDWRLCDLPIKVAGTPLAQRIAQINEELELKGIQFRPHYWLSDEWFTPDGVPGIAIPFYLAHPRLMRLEDKQMLEVEGGSPEWCLRILRHEVGHAIDNAYGLHRRRSWRDVFGKASAPYPEFYTPKPYSKSFVIHLDAWYAQSHPVEDFAETFAVWLKPRSRWRSQYQEWPALKKLQYVNQLMKEIRDKKPKITTRRKVEPVRTIRKTLREHYAQKRSHYGLEDMNYYDRDLNRLFSAAPEDQVRPTAAKFLSRLRPQLRKSVAHWTGEYQYTIDQVLSEMIVRCRELKLRLHGPEEDAERDAMIMLTMHVMNYLHDGHHRLAL